MNRRILPTAFGKPPLLEPQIAPAKVRLLDDFESGALPVTGGGAGQQRANRLNGLTVAANDAAHIGLSELEFKYRRFAGWNFRQHHFVGKLHQLPYDKLEELFHHFTCSGGL